MLTARGPKALPWRMQSVVGDSVCGVAPLTMHGLVRPARRQGGGWDLCINRGARHTTYCCSFYELRVFVAQAFDPKVFVRR